MDDDAKAFMRNLMAEFTSSICNSVDALSAKFDTYATVPAVSPMHTMCSVEGPRPALISAAAPKAPPATGNAVPVDAASSAVVAEVPTSTFPTPEQDTHSPSASVTTLLQEGVCELVLVPEKLHDSSSPTIIGLETLEVDQSAPTGFFSTSTVTCSTDCLPELAMDALMLDASSSSTTTAYGLKTNNIPIAAVPRALTNVRPVVPAHEVLFLQLCSNHEPAVPSSSRCMSSTIRVHRPLPWPSFIVDLVAGDERRPLPWPAFREINAMVSLEITSDSNDGERVPPHPPDPWSLSPGAWLCSRSEVSITVKLPSKIVRLCNDTEEVTAYKLPDEVQRHDEVQWQQWPPPFPWRMWITQEWYMFRPRSLALFECIQEGVPSMSPTVQLCLSPSSKLKVDAHSPVNKYMVTVHLLTHKNNWASFPLESAWQLEAGCLAAGEAFPLSVVEYLLVGATRLVLFSQLWFSQFIIKYFHWHIVGTLPILVTSKCRLCVVTWVLNPSRDPLCILFSPGHQYLSEAGCLSLAFDLGKHLFDTAAGHEQYWILQSDRANLYGLITQHGKCFPLFLHPKPPWLIQTHVDREDEEGGVLHLIGSLSFSVSCLIAKDQCIARAELCLNVLFLRAKEWAPDFLCVQHVCMIYYASLWHERHTTEITLQFIVNDSELVFLSSCSPHSSDSQMDGYWAVHDSRTLLKLRFAASYLTKRARKLLQISVHHWNSIRKVFQSTGAIKYFSWWVLNTWSPFVLRIYAHWLLLEHEYTVVDVLNILVLGWSDISVLSGRNTWVSEPEFSEFQLLNFYKRLCNPAVAAQLRVNPMELLTGEAAQISCGSKEFNCIIIRRSNYFSHLHCLEQLKWPCVMLASISIIRLVARVVHDLEFFRGRNALIRVTFFDLPNVGHYCYHSWYHLVVESWYQLMPIWSWDPGIISGGHYRTALLSAHCANGDYRDPNKYYKLLVQCMNVSSNAGSPQWCQWFFTGDDQAPFQGGRYTITTFKLVATSHKYFLDSRDIHSSYDDFFDDAYHLELVYDDLKYYRAVYHQDPNKLKELHVPWDPGKSAFDILQGLRLGDKPSFKEGGMSGTAPADTYTWAGPLGRRLGLARPVTSRKAARYKYTGGGIDELIQLDHGNGGGLPFPPPGSLPRIPFLLVLPFVYPSCNQLDP